MSDVPATRGGQPLLIDSPPPTRIGLPAGWRRALLTWLYLPTIASSAKSFRDNPAVGSTLLNRWGLHVARKRIAQWLGDVRRRQLAGLVSAEDRVGLERDGFIIKRNFLDEATFRALRAEITGLTADAREAVIGDTLTRLIPLDAVTMRALGTTRAVLDGPGLP